jgi:hypothetical protein
MNDTTTPEILLGAADVIVEHGHHKGGFMHRGAVCARGAINTVVNGDPNNCGGFASQADQVAQVLADHLGLESTIDFGTTTYVVTAIGWWNDAPDRTAEQVTAALRECAAALQDGTR